MTKITGYNVLLAVYHGTIYHGTLMTVYAYSHRNTTLKSNAYEETHMCVCACV